ncbi:hypothetical protein J2TS6_07450 [Paenibacillus albilobatus]|uniref:Uncharacterized protein n=1 Tax=Paenibacillus albilobatus TaxID=2716884 RepID=A0A920C9Y3_9BACL|nr:hypothetical protein J2TS6_07450 [Paenibacillus albilobatus]
MKSLFFGKRNNDLLNKVLLFIELNLHLLVYILDSEIINHVMISQKDEGEADHEQHVRPFIATKSLKCT